MAPHLARRFSIVSAILVVSAIAGLAVADASTTGEIGPALGITANGRMLHPVGRMTTVGNFPTGSALTPDGRWMWVTDCGHGSNDVKVVSIPTGAVVQTLPLPGCYGGIAITGKGTRAYVGGTPQGSSPIEGPVQGAQGDVVHVFTIDPHTGQGTEGAPIQLPATTAGSGRTKALPSTSGVGSAYPEGLAISPDGARLVVALNAADQAVIVNLHSLATSAVATGAYPNGVAFDRSGMAYVSNEYDGTVTVIDPASAKVVTTIAGLGGMSGDLNSHPEGLVADPVRDRIYVAVTNRDAIATIDTRSRKVIALTSVARPEGVGTAPVKLAVSPDGQTLYAADSGEDAIAAVSIADRPSAGVPVIPRAVVRAPKVGAITRYRRSVLQAAAHLRNLQPRQRAAARRRYRRQVRALARRYLRLHTVKACAGPTRRQATAFIRAVLRAQAARTPRRRRRMLARARRRLPGIERCRALPGYQPGLPALHLIGRLPTAAYPTDVQVTPDGAHLLWVAGKGMGSGPNPTYRFDGDKRPGQTPSNIYGTYVLDQLLGRVGELATPTDQQMARSTALTDTEVRPLNLTPQPLGSPIPAVGQGPSSQIKHVFYIVRENRTYDQVFGTDPRGDGSPRLTLFDNNGVAGPTGGVTPNAHALATQFPLLDHFYADSEVSVDGHLITAGAYATDYVQKALAANYSDRKRGMDFGIYPVSFPPKDFLFDQAVRQGISFRNYGEQGAGATPLGNAPNRPTYGGVAGNTDYSYPNNIFIGCLRPGGPPGNLSACTQDSGIYKGTGRTIGSQSRFNEWYPQFQSQVANNTVPALNYMILPNDHTNGTTPGDYTPQAMIAENDLALGQFVDAISHSSIWSSSAIFVVEDDSQDGADHVDSHRMPAFVISPWARHGAVVNARYDQYSVLRTIELLTGIAPLSLNDALATPMYDAFVSHGVAPDASPYNVVAPTQNIAEINGSSAPLARRSNALPWNRIDQVPQEISDAILYASVHGANAAPPPPGPNASPAEHARATAVRTALARHADVRALLAGAGDG